MKKLIITSLLLISLTAVKYARGNDTEHVRLWEGSSVTWDIFNKALVRRGTQSLEQNDFDAALLDFRAAVTYPENIGVGRPNNPQLAKEYYFIGKCLAALGKNQQAIKAYKTGASQKQGSDKQNEYRDLCQKALNEL